MKKIAFLVIGYNCPSVLSKMTNLFNDERFVFHVHVDSKISIENYTNNLAFKNSIFIKNRLNAFWGGFNIVRATIELSKDALSYEDYSHFCLISDDTYSLVNPDAFYDAIIDQPIRMEAWRLPLDRQDRYARFYRLDSLHSSARSVPMVEDRFVSIDDIIDYNRIKTLMERGKRPVRLCGGSQWWIMPRKILEAALSKAESDPWLCDSFEFSAVPDEHFFQTIVAEILGSELDLRNGPMYADFQRFPKPFVFQCVDEIQKEKIKGKLLIRKVADSEILKFLPDMGIA